MTADLGQSLPIEDSQVGLEGLPRVSEQTEHENASVVDDYGDAVLLTPDPPDEGLVLIVDDDGLCRKMLHQTLSSEGYSVVMAIDGDEGWVQFEAAEPCLVLLDIRMPGLSGLELLQRIRDRSTEVAVVMMTAYGSEEVAAQALRQGADDYLIKPFQPWQILATVQKNLEKARLRRVTWELMARVHESNVRLRDKHQDLQDRNVELQEAYQRLKDADEVRQNTVSMIVHDLKNPLNVILISLDLLATDFGDVLTEEQREILRSANLSSQQMLHLITNLLETQRLQDGMMPVHLQPLDIGRALRMTVRQAQALADRREVDLLLQWPDALPYVLADMDLTPRVVANLLDNAIKFSPPKGHIAVTAEPREGEVVVCVADSGPGVPADQQANIFQKFIQVDRGLSRQKASVGLGLAFCRLAVEAQGGRIWVDSEPGKGAQFKFALPEYQEESDASEHER